MQNLSSLTREQLEALVANMAKQAERKISMKVSEKGALSLYGLGRFPVTLYRSQWERLASAMPDVAKFIEANDKLLTTKA